MSIAFVNERFLPQVLNQAAFVEGAYLSKQSWLLLPPPLKLVKTMEQLKIDAAVARLDRLTVSSALSPATPAPHTASTAVKLALSNVKTLVLPAAVLVATKLVPKQQMWNCASLSSKSPPSKRRKVSPSGEHPVIGQ